MAENNINVYCSICGHGYYICNSCSDQKKFRPWRTVTDTIEHYKIYMAVHGYTVTKDKDKAKAELQNCDLSGLENFNSGIKAVVKEILAENRKSKAALKTKKESADIILKEEKNEEFNE